MFNLNQPFYLLAAKASEVSLIDTFEQAILLMSSISLQDWAWVGVAINIALTLFVGVRVITTQRNTGVAITWIVLLFAIPVFSVIAYLLVGEPYLGKSYKSRNAKAKALLDKITHQTEQSPSNIEALLTERYQGVSRIGMLDTGFGVYEGHRMQLLTAADDTFDALIADINNAQSLILMEFYIIFAKGRVNEVFAALAAAAKRGVECQLLADSVGSFSFFTDDWHVRLSEAGVIIHQSLPVGLFKTLFKRSDLRNHRKIVVIDEKIGYTGSFNLVDSEFFKQDQGVGEWIDLIMRIESSEPANVVRGLAAVSVTDISAESSTNLSELSKRIDSRINSYTRKLLVHSKPTINDVNDRAPNYLKDIIATSNMSDEYGRSLHQKEDDFSDISEGAGTSKSAANSQTNSHLSSQVKKQASSQNDTNSGFYSDSNSIARTHSKNNDLKGRILESNEQKSGDLEQNYSTNQSKQSDNTTIRALQESDLDGVKGKGGKNTGCNDNGGENKSHDASHSSELLPQVDNVVAQLIPSAPRLTGNVIYDTLLTVLHRANWRIQITTPYFVPDEALLSALTTAAKRGVEVILIVPKKVDSFLVQHASQASYAILMEAGVKIGLFEGGLLHAKTVVIDEDYCLFGTVNMDMRSFYLNMEISLALYTPEIVAQVIDCHKAYMGECVWVDAKKWHNRAAYRKLFDSTIRLFSPLL